MVNILSNEKHCKRIIDLNYPFLKKVDVSQELHAQRMVNGYSRYYAKTIEITGEKFFVCNDWYDRQRNKYELWLDHMKLNLNENQNGEKEVNMNESPIIKGKHVLLRKPVESDVQDRFNCGRSLELIRLYGGSTKDLEPFTMESANYFINSILSEKLNWCVEFEGRCIGEARLTVSEQDNRAKYAVGLFDASVWDKGLGTEITQLLLHYAFNELQLHRVDLRVLEYNRRAIACYEKCGFIKEGTEREGALVEGKYETDVFMSILDREFRAMK